MPCTDCLVLPSCFIHVGPESPWLPKVMGQSCFLFQVASTVPGCRLPGYWQIPG
jgi:hypothetical protein